MNLKSGHYISTGALNCFYTLRYWFEEQVRINIGDGLPPEISVRTRDYFLRNLSTNREEAIAKAKEHTGKDLSASFDLNKIHRRSEIDWSIFQAGKYEGNSIHWVAENDKDYLCWVCENCANSDRYTKTVELAKALVAHELASRASERNEKKIREDLVRERIKAVLAPYAQSLADGRMGFCDGIAYDFKNGILPSPRALAIVTDILAKSAGRRNSKAYEAEWARIDDIFGTLSALNRMDNATPFTILKEHLGAIHKLQGDIFGDKIAYTTEAGECVNTELVLREDEDDPQSVILETVFTPQPLRRSGMATRAMKSFLTCVDTLGMTVTLCVDPHSASRRDTPPMDTEQLRSWYRKFGFVFRGESHYGCRLSEQALARFREETVAYDADIHGTTIELPLDQTYSDPSSLRECFELRPNKFKEGTVYDAGGTAYTVGDGKLKRFRGVELNYDFGTGMHTWIGVEDYDHGPHDPAPPEEDCSVKL